LVQFGKTYLLLIQMCLKIRRTNCFSTACVVSFGMQTIKAQSYKSHCHIIKETICVHF